MHVFDRPHRTIVLDESEVDSFKRAIDFAITLTKARQVAVFSGEHQGEETDLEISVLDRALYTLNAIRSKL